MITATATTGCGLQPRSTSASINSLQVRVAGLARSFINRDPAILTIPPIRGRSRVSTRRIPGRITPGLTLNFGLSLRNRFSTSTSPTTYYGDVAPRISFAWDPFKDHKTVIRGGYGIFYGPIDSQIPAVDLSLGVLNKNKSTVENHYNASQVPDQVQNAIGTCGVRFYRARANFPYPPVADSNSPCTRFISPFTRTHSLPLGLPIPGKLGGGVSDAICHPRASQEIRSGANLISCTVPGPGTNACITPADVIPSRHRRGE